MSMHFFTAQIVETLVACGLPEKEIKASIWIHSFQGPEYLSYWPRTTDEVIVKRQFEEAVQTIHKHVWFLINTEFSRIYQESATADGYRSGTKSRQDATRRRSCFRPAMELWVQTQPSLEAALTLAPEHIHEEVKTAWQKMGGGGSGGRLGSAAGAAALEPAGP